MPEIALALFVLCAASCAQRGPDIARHTIAAAPATIRVELDDAARDALTRRLSARSLDVARVILHDVHPIGRELKGVRIFIEKPDADLKTPTDDPHYAGSFVPGFAPPETINLNIAPTLAKVWAAGERTRASLSDRKAIRLTLVPEPWEPAVRLSPEFSMTIQSITLEVPKQ